MANSEFDSRKDCNKSADQAAATRHARKLTTFLYVPCFFNNKICPENGASHE